MIYLYKANKLLWHLKYEQEKLEKIESLNSFR